MMKAFLKGVRRGWTSPVPRGTRRAGFVAGLVVGWAAISAAAA
jgi:hypothetical protein